MNDIVIFGILIFVLVYLFINININELFRVHQSKVIRKKKKSNKVRQ
jgi:hypothetical protein